VKATALGIESDVRNLQSQEARLQSDFQMGQARLFHCQCRRRPFRADQELTAEQWQETIDINLTGVFFSAKASIAALTESKGYFINIQAWQAPISSQRYCL
jgi:3-oxoacyl-[acyl-carrier protein] reductase